MLPNTNNLLTTNLNIEEEPSKNYKMKVVEKTISGYVDELEAMKQVVYKILNAERYQYQIYSWNYGVELIDLIGENTSYVVAELERRISEALIQDDRIESVDSFEFDYSEKGIVTAKFTVHTIYGNFDEEKVVNY